MRTNAVVTAMFPKNVRERILRDIEAKAAQNDFGMEEGRRGKHSSNATRGLVAQKRRMKTFLDRKDRSVKDHNREIMDSEELLESTPPIADLVRLCLAIHPLSLQFCSLTSTVRTCA